jgi:hypothetical protein
VLERWFLKKHDEYVIRGWQPAGSML